MNSLLKYLHAVINILYLATGLLLVGFGLYIRFSSGTQELLKSLDANVVLVYGTLAIGGLVFLVGCCGALGLGTESKALLLINLSVNLLFVIAELGVAIYVILQRDAFDTSMRRVWNDFDNDTKSLIQNRFNCCGYSSPNEWGDEFPKSCFNDTSVQDEPTIIWTETCYDAVDKFLSGNLIIVASILGLTIVLQVFEIIVSCFLVRELRQMDRVRQSGATDRKRHTQTETTIR